MFSWDNSDERKCSNQHCWSGTYDALGFSAIVDTNESHKEAYQNCLEWISHHADSKRIQMEHEKIEKRD